MSTPAPAPSLRASLAAGGAILGFCLFLAVGKKLDLMTAETARQVAGIGFALLLIAGGNTLPKLVTPVGEDAPAHGEAQRADRRAGAALVLAGIVEIVAWLALPDQVALVSSAVAAIVGCGAAAALLARGGRLRPHPASARGSLFQVVLALGWVGVLFLLDFGFGDAVAQTSAVVFILLQGALAGWWGRCGTKGLGASV
jgi:hypothetical protein